MGLYTTNGLLNGYKKNNKERAALDYYATPTAEVENILNILKLDFSNKTILEPCIGGGHMVEGILSYCDKNHQVFKKFTGTDWLDRGYVNKRLDITYGLDFLDDNYPHNNVDIIVMNPPYVTLEPFLIRGLEIATKQLIVLCRTQVLEGVNRYKNIFSKNPPTAIYQYIDRINCLKNGENPNTSSAQAYCWLLWDKTLGIDDFPPVLYWMHRI